jgi:hypothetical protein
VAASAFAMSMSTSAFEDSSGRDWARRSGRSGSVAAARVFAMSANVLTFQRLSVMDWAVRSASSMSRAARSGSVAASVSANVERQQPHSPQVPAIVWHRCSDLPG